MNLQLKTMNELLQLRDNISTSKAPLNIRQSAMESVQEEIDKRNNQEFLVEQGEFNPSEISVRGE